MHWQQSEINAANKLKFWYLNSICFAILEIPVCFLKQIFFYESAAHIIIKINWRFIGIHTLTQIFGYILIFVILKDDGRRLLNIWHHLVTKKHKIHNYCAKYLWGQVKFNNLLHHEKISVKRRSNNFYYNESWRRCFF